MELPSLSPSSKAQPLVAFDTPTISSVANPNSPGISGYTSNSGSNMGGETLTISGSNFSGTTITVTFTPTINTTSPVISLQGTLQADGKTIQVASPAPASFGAVEVYVVNVCVDGSCSTYTSSTATESQMFHSLATLVYSAGAQNAWTADINVANNGTVTIINKDSTQSHVVDFWQPGGPPWNTSTNIGGAATANLVTAIALSATNSGTANLAVLVTVDGKTPTAIGGPDVGSNGNINVGTSGG